MRKLDPEPVGIEEGQWHARYSILRKNGKKVWRKRYRTWRRPRNESLVFVTCNDYNGTESTTIPVHQACGLKPLERGENEEKPVYTMFGNCYHAASTTRQPLTRAHLCAWKVRTRSCASRNSKKSCKKSLTELSVCACLRTFLTGNRCYSVSSFLRDAKKLLQHYSLHL